MRQHKNRKKQEAKPLYGLWHQALPYLEKRFVDDDEAWKWARVNGYRYDGRITREQGYLKAAA